MRVDPPAAPQAHPSELPLRLEPARVVRRKWLPDFVARRIFGAPLAPTAAEWARIVAALQRGDPPMDELVAWMLEDARHERRAMFERALAHGIDSLDDPAPALCRFFAHVDAAPPWLDRALLARGARTARMVGIAGYYVLRDMALMGGYVYFNSMNQTLAATGALRKNVKQRLGETGKWLADAVAPEGLQRFGVGFVATIRVRMVHALVRRAVKNGADWSTDHWGLPINQIDMMATYLAFGPVTLSGSRLFGVPVLPRDAHAAMHMWRYIGWLLGVEEPWLALGELDGLRKLYHASLTHRLPDAKVRQFGQALRDEPLTRHLPALSGRPWLRALVRRYHYEKHIANSALVLGPLQRHRLGLPLFAVPWYLVLTAPLRFLTLCWFRWRGGNVLEGYLRRSAAQQQSLLASYFASDEATVHALGRTDVQPEPRKSRP